ncbi:MAG: molecular chaperone GrpE [Mycobacteriales bacterium]|jgi:molecular chaperone GrpE
MPEHATRDAAAGPAPAQRDTASPEKPGPAGKGASLVGDGASAGNGAEPADDAATIAQLRAEVARLADQWRRTAADLENLRKRVAREAGQQRADERARIAAEWLPVLDNLELALEHASSNPAVILEGVQAVRDQALAVLARLGYTRQADVGSTFDPARHEAVAAVPDPTAAPGTVVHVVRPGYGGAERQLRPASVVVATRAD